MAAEDLKLIRHNAARVDRPDDPSYPFRLDVELRAPSGMIVAFVSIYGPTEILCVRGKTREALEEFVEANKLRTHIRLRTLTITQPEATAAEAAAGK